MTITSTPTIATFDGDGVSVNFPIPFPFDDAADLKLIETDSDGNASVVSAGYSVAGGGGSTGTLVRSTALASGISITILDNPALTQDVDYIVNDAFPAESHERALDRIVRMVKRLSQRVDRAFTFADGDPISSGAIGSVDNRKGKYLFFNAVTGAIEYAVALATTVLSQSIIAQLLNPQTAAEIAASVTPTNYLYTEGQVYRYGTNTTPGTTDMATAINAAIAVMSHHSNGGAVTLPAEICRVASTVNAAVNVALVGHGGQASRLYADNCDGITIGFTTYFGKTVIRDLEILGVNSTTRYGIRAPGTLLNTDQTYGVVVERVNIRQFNVGISYRTVWHSDIVGCRIENVERALELIGQNVVTHITRNKFIHGSGGGGAGSAYGINLDAFNYTTLGGTAPPEGSQIFANLVYGFSTAIHVVLANFVNIVFNDLWGSVGGIDATTVNLGFNIVGNYLDMNTASVVAGIYLRAVLAPSSGQSTIRDNSLTANTTTTAVGVKINDSSNGGQSDVLIENNAFTGFNSNDILVDHAGFTRIIGNKCQSSGPTNSISVPAVASGFVSIRENNCLKDINYVAADAAAGLVLHGPNIKNGATLVGAAGVFTTPAFNAGNFTANGAMTWTVASGDIATFEYEIVQNRMTVIFALNTTTVAGTPNTTLKIAIPGGKVAAKQAYNALGYLNDNGTIRNGIASVVAGGTTINIDRQDAANFTAATDTTYVKGQITFEIQ